MRQNVVLFTVSTTVEVMYMCIAIKHPVLRKKYSMSLMSFSSSKFIPYDGAIFVLMLFTVMSRKSESVVLRHTQINTSD